MSRSVDRFVCVSKELVPRAQRAFGVSGKKMRVIHNGIEGISAPLGETRERGRNVIIGSVGRVTYLKNYELLIEAFGDVLKIRPSCRLEIVGDGEAFGRIAGLVKALSLDERVTLHGAQLDVDRYLARFDIFALSSISEGHSIAILEALRLKKVCVVSAVGGNTEIIADGSNGYLFESGNKADLVRKLVFVIDNLHTPEMDRIRQQAVETIRSKFSREQMVAAYEHVYEELLGDRAAGAP
jgi:glycosyltransferase involved in cell wall biosynthesis